MEFTIGTDPEFMLRKNGNIFSSIGIVDGTKQKKKKSGDYEFYCDNVLVEVALPPSKTRQNFIDNIKNCLIALSKEVAPYEPFIQSSHVYDKSQLNCREALEISCTPEICAYEMQGVAGDSTLFERVDLRSAGGHIHLGSEVILRTEKDFPVNKFHTIRLLDLFLGIPSILIDKDPTSNARREIYGKAGRFRDTPYGVEYRSMSNFWLGSPVFTGLIYDICEFTLNFIDQGLHNELWEIDVDRFSEDSDEWLNPDFHPSQCHICKNYNVSELRNVIDNSDFKGAKEYLSGFIKDYMPSDLYESVLNSINYTPNKQLSSEWNF